MRPQLMITVIAIFFLGTVLCCVSSGRWLANGEVDIFRALASFSTVQVPMATGWEAPRWGVNYLAAFQTALTWDYPFLSSSWCIFLKFPLWCLSAAFVWALIEIGIQIFGAIASAVTAIGNALRGLTGL